MAIPLYDFSVKQGNSGTVQNPAGLVVHLKEQDGSPRDLSNGEILFFAYWQGETRVRMSSAASEIAIDTVLGSITVAFDVQTFRAARAGATVFYEVEHRQGDEQRTVLQGKIEIQSGINDD
ncbi:MAG: hypothetical protein AAFW87_05715 [Pseudomonadota bacterium]